MLVTRRINILVQRLIVRSCERNFYTNLASDRLLDRSLRDRSDVMHRSLILNTFRGNLSGFPQNAFSRTTVFHQRPAFRNPSRYPPRLSTKFLQSSYRRILIFISANLLLDAPILGTVLHHRQSLTEILADRLQVFGI